MTEQDKAFIRRWAEKAHAVNPENEIKFYMTMYWYAHPAGAAIVTKQGAWAWDGTSFSAMVVETDILDD